MGEERKRLLRVFLYILITLGAIFLAENIGLVEGAFSRYWPLLLIVAGAVMVLRDVF